MTKSSIFWNYLRNKDRGINYDVREEIYQKVNTMTMDDLNAFFTQRIAKGNYVYLVIADKDELDMEIFKPYGEITEYSLEELFGY